MKKTLRQSLKEGSLDATQSSADSVFQRQNVVNGNMSSDINDSFIPESNTIKDYVSNKYFVVILNDFKTYRSHSGKEIYKLIVDRVNINEIEDPTKQISLVSCIDDILRSKHKDCFIDSYSEYILQFVPVIKDMPKLVYCFSNLAGEQVIKAIFSNKRQNRQALLDEFFSKNYSINENQIKIDFKELLQMDPKFQHIVVGSNGKQIGITQNEMLQLMGYSQKNEEFRKFLDILWARRHYCKK